MIATVSNQGTLTQVHFNCACGYPLTAWVLSSGPVFYRRGGPPREPLRLAMCPGCKTRWPRLSGEEFLEAVAR